MSKERLEEIKNSYNFWMEEDESIGLLPEDIEWLIEQAEQVDYYKHQSKRKTQALEEIADLLTEDYFENWEQALEIAHKYKRNSVRLDNLGSDLRIREMEEKNE